MVLDGTISYGILWNLMEISYGKLLQHTVSEMAQSLIFV